MANGDGGGPCGWATAVVRALLSSGCGGADTAPRLPQIRALCASVARKPNCLAQTASHWFRQPPVTSESNACLLVVNSDDTNSSKTYNVDVDVGRAQSHRATAAPVHEKHEKVFFVITPVRPVLQLREPAQPSLTG